MAPAQTLSTAHLLPCNCGPFEARWFIQPEYASAEWRDHKYRRANWIIRWSQSLTKYCRYTASILRVYCCLPHHTLSHSAAKCVFTVCLRCRWPQGEATMCYNTTNTTAVLLIYFYYCYYCCCFYYYVINIKLLTIYAVVLDNRIECKHIFIKHL